MGIKDELKAIEDALSGDEAQAKGWLATFYAAHRTKILIGGALVLVALGAVIF